ncbi:MAG TPA: response regulator [Allosphingosinicella sp.]|nr:response regulator [Allosphingosinicella sp.]
MSENLAILIVEDEPLIAMMLEDFLDSLGHRIVATAESVREAIGLIEAGGFDVAILDVHLRGGEQAWPVADRLTELGLPFVLATGGQIDPPPPRHAAAPVLAKPYTVDAIEPALAAACANGDRIRA